MRILQPICHYLRENADLLLAILIQMHYICIWSSEKQNRFASFLRQRLPLRSYRQTLNHENKITQRFQH